MEHGPASIRATHRRPLAPCTSPLSCDRPVACVGTVRTYSRLGAAGAPMKGVRTPRSERRGFFLRFALGTLLLAAGALGRAFAPGCSSGTIVDSRCPVDREGKLTVPLECCPCPTPEDCDYFYYSKGLTPPPVPASSGHAAAGAVARRGGAGGGGWGWSR